MLLKESSPIVGPLLIDVMEAALLRDGRRKEDDGRKADKRGDKPISELGFQMLCNFKAERQIKRSGEADGLRDIQWEKLHVGNGEQASIYVVTIDTQDIYNPT